MNQFKGHPTTQQIDVPLKDIRKRRPLRVLSPADWTHWTTFGYVVVPAAVPEPNLSRLVDLLWEFSGSRAPGRLRRPLPQAS